MDVMSEYSYDADLAGLSYKLETQSDGILLNIDGYNDKLPVLAKVVMEKMRALDVVSNERDRQRFEMVKDQARRRLENFNLAAPQGLSVYWMTYMLTAKAYRPEDKLTVLKGECYLIWTLHLIALFADFSACAPQTSRPSDCKSSYRTFSRGCSSKDSCMETCLRRTRSGSSRRQRASSSPSRSRRRRRFRHWRCSRRLVAI